jgi:signal transduction histidine kinase
MRKTYAGFMSKNRALEKRNFAAFRAFVSLGGEVREKMGTALQVLPQGAGPLKILVVEDDPDDRALYRRMLSGSRFEITEARDVKSGLGAAARLRPDCILLEYHLPDATGLDFIRRFRAAGGESAVVMVTGHGSEKTAAAAMRMGALDYITKSSITDGFFLQSVLNAVEHARLKGQIAEYQKKLERKNQGLTEFAYSAAHDLKAPLRRVASYCQMLREEAEGALNEKSRGYIDRMSVNIARLQNLIDGLLIYSTAASSKEPEADVDLNRVLADIMEDLGETIRASAAAVSVGPMPTVRAGPVRVKQLFQNLISNAIKYRSAEPPRISITCADAGTHYIFSCRDNGVGVPEEFREKIFRPFERLHTQEQVEGSGLGLAICRRVVRMHGGRIWVEPAEGGGSVFRFTLAK